MRFSVLLATACALACGGGAARTARPPGTAPAPADSRAPVTLAVVWGAEPDQERYRAQVELETRAALRRAGIATPGGPAWTLRIDRVVIETPYENNGSPLPGQERTPVVTVRPRAVIEAALTGPDGVARRVTANWTGAFQARDPGAYRELAFQHAAERTAERAVAVIVRAAR